MRIDHVVLGSRDLDVTARRYLEAYGLGSVEGGRHAAWGTANRIVPLGDDYLEFLSVVDRERAAESAFGRSLSELTADGDRWATVCVADDDLDGTAARLGADVVSGSRVRPDGVEVRWRSVGLDHPRREPWMPFFISWEVQPEAHPGRMSAELAAPANGIGRVEVAGDGARLREWLGGAELPIRVVGGEPGIRAVTLATSSGELEIRA